MISKTISYMLWFWANYFNPSLALLTIWCSTTPRRSIWLFDLSSCWVFHLLAITILNLEPTLYTHQLKIEDLILLFWVHPAWVLVCWQIGLPQLQYFDSLWLFFKAKLLISLLDGLELLIILLLCGFPIWFGSIWICSFYS